MRVEEVTITVPVGPGGDPSGAALVTLVEKRLSTRERGVPEAAARLRREIELLLLLRGHVTPHVVDHGEDERGPWVRLERIVFPTVAGRLASAAGGILSAEWIERAARGAFTALAEIHEASDDRGPLAIVHADFSPANVAVDDEGARVVLLDFELASWRDAPARDGAFRGTVGYCAPEIARGEPPRPTSDVFSLAATFLHAAIGRPPRDGPSLAAVLATAAEQPVTAAADVDAIAARGPAHAAIVRCLAHDPRDRPDTARAVLALL